jgi:hypothetical protein
VGCFGLSAVRIAASGERLVLSRLLDPEQGRWLCRGRPKDQRQRVQGPGRWRSALMGSPAGQPQSAGESSRAGGRRPGALDARAAAYRRVGRSLPALGLLTGGVATIAGSVLPWVVFGPIHLNGLHRDGVITLPLAAAAVPHHRSDRAHRCPGHFGLDHRRRCRLVARRCW